MVFRSHAFNEVDTYIMGLQRLAETTLIRVFETDLMVSFSIYRRWLNTNDDYNPNKK